MQTNTSTVMTLPLQGDYAAAVRNKSEARRARGTFTTGTSGSTARLVRHHGDFAAGISSHLHVRHAVPADFASRARVNESPSTA